MILARIQVQEAIPCAVINGRVLETFLARDRYFLDVDLHTVARVLFPAEDRVAGAPGLGPSNRGVAKILTNSADCRGGYPNVMHPFKPNPCPHRPKLQIAASLLD